MSVYNQFHDETTAFHNDMMVYFSQCNPNKRISLNELLRVTSDTAVEDFAERKMSRGELENIGIAILVSRVSFRIHRFPVENEHFTVHTIEEKSEPLQFVRSYEIISDKGEKLVTGLSSWLLVDVNGHRILPIKKFDEMGLRVPMTEKKDHDCLPYGKIQNPDDMTLFDERVIKYSDLDSNGHTTNSRYGAFVADAIPSEYRDVVFKDFRLNYAKEAKLGQKLQVFGKVNTSENLITLVGKTEEGTSFEAELYW